MKPQSPRFASTPLGTLLRTAAGLAILASTPDAGASDVIFYSVNKTQHCWQSDAGLPVERPFSSPAGFHYGWHSRAQVYFTAATNLLSGWVGPAGSLTEPLVLSDDGLCLEFLDDQPTQVAMDASVPNGTYTLLMNTTHDGTRSADLTLAGSVYPPAAHLLNFSTLQNVNPAAALTVSWDAIAGGTSSDYIVVGVLDSNDQTVFHTPFPNQAGVLRGTNLSAVIPAGTLRASTSYIGYVAVSKVCNTYTAPYPGVLGFCWYGRITEFVLSTVGAPTNSPATRYVDLNNPTPTAPYTNWATAARAIQDAVDAAVDGDRILVTNGVYQTGARAVYAMSNRVAMTKAVVVRSINGPAVTSIVGYRAPGTTNGANAVRCVYMTNGAVLAGFTLTNGSTQTGGNMFRQQTGGGVYCESTSAVISNCTLTGNSAYYQGGGAYYGTFNNCTFTGNSADHFSGYTGQGGGAYYATLNNCTLTGNFSSADGGGTCGGALNNCSLTGNSAFNGGGASFGILKNCIVMSNFASLNGGGAYNSTLINSAVAGNSAASSGGGAYGGALTNCTLTANLAGCSGGGGAQAKLANCIVYYNSALSDPNYVGCVINYSCTTPLPPGLGNLSDDPQLAGNTHLSAASPCRAAGSAAFASELDIDGEPWATPPSIGCDECQSGAVTGTLSAGIGVDYTNVAAGFGATFQALISGRTTGAKWDFGDGTVVSNRPYVSHGWATIGDYSVVLRAFNETYPAGLAATVTVHVVPQPVHYAALNNLSPLAPYNSWATAATNIQDAVDAAKVGGALVLVSNGVYQAGARAIYGMSNRVAVTKAVVLKSVNGPLATSIAGYAVPGTTNGASAVRCVYLANGAVLSGFTLTHGATQLAGDQLRQQSGGGVWCEWLSALVTNCTLAGNSANYDGGGACFGTLNGSILAGNSAADWGGGASFATLNDCTVTSNSAHFEGGGAYSATLNNCALTGNIGDGASTSTLNDCTLTGNIGSGVSSSTLNNCTLTGNSAPYSGGGASYSTLSNCTLVANYAPDGGGASGGTLYNCTLTANSASHGGGAYSATLYNCTLAGNSASNYAGGAYYGTLNNCVVYYNSAPSYTNYYLSGLNYCCATPLPPGPGNFADEPGLVDQAASDLHLQTNSPCINSGLNAYAAGSTDLDGHPRIAGGTVDVGAYEFAAPRSLISYAWLQAYGLATDGSADYADPDRDGRNNWQEWVAGTDPTNAASVLCLLSASNSPSGIVLAWASVTNRAYSLERTTNLAGSPNFALVRSNIPGAAGATSFTDTNTAGPGPFFYRVRVEQ